MIRYLRNKKTFALQEWEQQLYCTSDFTYLVNKLKSAFPLTFYNEQKLIGCQGSQHHCSAGSTG